MKTYITKCGCRMQKSQLALNPKSKMICPNHGKGIDFIERICKRCGEIFQIPPRRGVVENCEECRKELKRERQRRNYQQSMLRKKKKKESFRGEYCMGYNVCSSEGKLKCDDCDTFTPLFRGWDPLKRNLWL